MSHHHHHHHVPATLSRKRLLVAILLNFAITIAEIIGGIISGSLALISDALHNFSDGLAIIISYAAIKLGARPKSLQFTFGLKRAEILAAILNSATLIAICIYLFIESYKRFVDPEPISGSMIVIVATIALLANIFCMVLLRGISRGNMNIRAAYLHIVSDVVTSLAVVIGGLAIHFYRIYWIDPLITVLISLYILKESFDIVKDATGILMMSTPQSLSLPEVKSTLEALPGVKNIHHVHAWALTEHNIHFEAHIDVDDMMVSETGSLSQAIEQKLKEEFSIDHVTLQFECNACHSKALV